MLLVQTKNKDNTEKWNIQDIHSALCLQSSTHTVWPKHLGLNINMGNGWTEVDGSTTVMLLEINIQLTEVGVYCLSGS